MSAGNSERLLCGMRGLFADAMQQQGSGDDGFIVFIRFCQADEQRPPVINQGNHAGDEAARFDFLGHKTAPAPLVFDFIKVVLAIGAITIVLDDADHLVSERGD